MIKDKIEIAYVVVTLILLFAIAFVSGHKQTSAVSDYTTYEIVDDGLIHNKLVEYTEKDIITTLTSNSSLWLLDNIRLAFADIDFDDIPEFITINIDDVYVVYSIDPSSNTMQQINSWSGYSDGYLACLSDKLENTISWYYISDKFISSIAVSAENNYILLDENSSDIQYTEMHQQLVNRYETVNYAHALVKSYALSLTEDDLPYVLSVLLTEYYS